MPGMASVEQREPDRSKKKKWKQKKRVEGPPASKATASVPITSPARRKTSRGVRVVGRRIYDSENGKSCHQCRQKTMDFSVSCKNVRVGKACGIHFCHKCLVNRYGEKAEEMAVLDAWSCPKCRGICNCSFCMKKKGHQPTGILVHAAKATGFSSVLELLHNTGSKASDAQGTECKASGQKKLKRKLKNETQSQDVLPIQENGSSIDGKVNKEGMHSEPKKNRKAKKVNPVPKHVGDVPMGSAADEENTNKREEKKKKIKKFNERNKVMGETGERTSTDTSVGNTRKIVEKDRRTSMDVSEKSIDMTDENEGASNDVSNKFERKKKNVAKKKQLRDLNVVSGDTRASVNVEKHPKVVKSSQRNLPSRKTEVDNGNIGSIAEASTMLKALQRVNFFSHVGNGVESVDIILPQGIALTTVAGHELPVEDVGPALQFLEFCATFRQVLGLKTNQPESLLRELLHGRIGRRPLNSPIVQFHIKLLSFIQEDEGEESPSCLTRCSNFWLEALKKVIGASQAFLKELSPDSFVDGIAGYNSLDFSTKLKVLNFLCDEILTTDDIRNWIDEENSKFAERKRETKANILAAKEKEKIIKQKLKDHIAQSMLSLRNGAPLTIKEHDNLVLEIKSKLEEVQHVILDSKQLSQKRKQRSDAVRTEPLLWDECGQVFWRLKGYSDCSHIVLQDIGNFDLLGSRDKWFFYNDNQEKVVEKHISWIRNKRLKWQRHHTRHASWENNGTVYVTSSSTIVGANDTYGF